MVLPLFSKLSKHSWYLCPKWLAPDYISASMPVSSDMTRVLSYPASILVGISPHPQLVLSSLDGCWHPTPSLVFLLLSFLYRYHRSLRYTRTENTVPPLHIGHSTLCILQWRACFVRFWNMFSAFRTGREHAWFIFAVALRLFQVFSSSSLFCVFASLGQLLYIPDLIWSILSTNSQRSWSSSQYFLSFILLLCIGDLASSCIHPWDVDYCWVTLRLQ